MKLTKRLLYKEYAKNRKNPMGERCFIKRLDMGYTYWQLLEIRKHDRITMPESKPMYRRHLTNKYSQQ